MIVSMNSLPISAITVYLLFTGVSNGSLAIDKTIDFGTEPEAKGSLASIPACIADFDGCDASSVIYKTGTGSYPICDFPLGLMDYRDFYYYCRRFQCLNGHYYVLDGYYYTDCSWGPTNGLPTGCPNNSCNPTGID